MDLFSLDGNTLKVYLGLLAGRDPGAGCRLSHSALSRQVRLSRTTVLRALQHLHQGGWIQGQAGHWQVTPGPLAALVGVAGESPHRRGPVPCPENDHPGTCPENDHRPPPCPESGQRPVQILDSPAPPPTRARTVQSSSTEEDVLGTPPLLSSPGGLGGENHPPETPATGGEEKKRETPSEPFLQEMQALWQQLAPDDRTNAQPWFRQLHTEFGPQIPLQVFQQFADRGWQRQELHYPHRYQSYFRTCCRNAQLPTWKPYRWPERPARRNPANDPGGTARSRPMAPETAIDNQDQVAQFLAAYRAEDDRQQAAFERQMAPFLAAQQQGLRRRKTS